jgi:pimeloyl-ACP methyl ester carboxylesterase
MPVTTNIYYNLHEEGDAETPPIVLIHGAGGTHLHWPTEIRRLPGHRVYALDLPGHGKSGGRGQQSIEKYAKMIVTWLDVVGIYRAIFVGHSMGGAITQTLAIRYPERVLALGLVGTGARLRVAPAILDTAASPATFPLAVETIIAWAFNPQSDPRLVEMATRRMMGTRPTVLHGDFLACNSFDLMDSIKKIRFPTLVICGQNDQLTPARYSQYLADQIPSAQLTIVPAAGHMVMLEQPKQAATALADFIASIQYRPGFTTVDQ